MLDLVLKVINSLVQGSQCVVHCGNNLISRGFLLCFFEKTSHGEMMGSGKGRVECAGVGYGDQSKNDARKFRSNLSV